MSVGFADKEEKHYLKKGYKVEKSRLGNVYIPTKNVEIVGKIGIRYEVYPWIEQFEVDGIKALGKKEKRKKK